MDTAGKPLALARHFLEIGQPGRALETLDRASGVPADAAAHALRGLALHDLGRYADAARVARAGLAREPESLPLLRLLCDAEARLGNLAEAERAILAALRLAPDEPRLLCRYAHLVAGAGQADKARRLVEEAARLAPDDPAVLRARVALSYVGGDDRATAARSRDLLARDPDDEYGHRMLGAALSSRGAVTQAERHLRTAARFDPADPDLAEATRATRLAAHPLLWPLRPLRRFGVIPVWLGAIAIIFGLRSLGLQPVAAVVGLAYFLLCVYSWVVPPLLRWWLDRRG